MKHLHASLPCLALLVMLVGCRGDDDNAPTNGDGSTTTASTTASTEDPTLPSTSSDAESTGTGMDPSGDETSVAQTDDGTSSDASTTGSGVPVVTLETTLGDIVIQLDPDAAPITTQNFLAYVESGFYDGSDGLGATIFHRVIPDFMIQGGGLTESMVGKATMAPIINESGNGLSNVRGAIAMARTSDPNSATAQFFINVVDNPGLDNPPGYAVFGEVVEGMDVVDAIVSVDTTTAGAHQNVPVEPIVILSAVAR